MQYKYRGYIIKEDCNDKSFGRNYITIIKPNCIMSNGRNVHTHAPNDTIVRKVIDHVIRSSRSNIHKKYYSTEERKIMFMALPLFNNGVCKKLSHNS